MESGSAEIDDYEALPENASASTHMIAGATAGITEHCIMYPIDSIKVRNSRLSILLKDVSVESSYYSTTYVDPALIA